eukprot:TRINITY_DN55192_c0_g1_i1.p1 TRINITY_DN55192_c0_g1~~TRINITY_DN55192_c0_g1_i1.p1  ORF type:complete len:233 (+),score=75.95 TRINITY_DN55192_c0_g1_i1:83-781(+)
MARPVELRLPDSAEAWRSAGFAVSPGGSVDLGALQLRLGAQKASVGFAGLPDGVAELDGMSVHAADPADAQGVAHPNGVSALDALSLQTGDCDRTRAALAAVGMQPAKETSAVRKGFSMLFYRPPQGPIIEIAGPSKGAAPPLRLWGVMLVSPDLDAFCRALPQSTKPPWTAVQPGRRITTLRGKHHGISIAVAVLSPHVRGAIGKASEAVLAARARKQDAELRSRSERGRL